MPRQFLERDNQIARQDVIVAFKVVSGKGPPTASGNGGRCKVNAARRRCCCCCCCCHDIITHTKEKIWQQMNNRTRCVCCGLPLVLSTDCNNEEDIQGQKNDGDDSEIKIRKTHRSHLGKTLVFMHSKSESAALFQEYSMISRIHS